MTEAEWDRCTDPTPMLQFLEDSGKATDRKLRLFACACCYRFRQPKKAAIYSWVLRVAEELADKEVTPAEVLDGHEDLQRELFSLYVESVLAQDGWASNLLAEDA